MRYLVVAMVAACGGVPNSAEVKASNAPYEIVLEQRASALLRLVWKGAGRDLDSGKFIDVPENDMRRNAYLSVNFGAKDPMLWRSNLLRRLKSGELTMGDLQIDPVEHGELVRAYILREPRLADAFFRQSDGRNLDADNYIAECFVALESATGAVECSTELTVDSFAVKVTFDQAFLWDFDNLSAQAVAEAKNYLARPGTRLAIERIAQP